MKTRSGRIYLEEEKIIIQNNINNEFMKWKNRINRRFFLKTGYNLEDIRDLSYYDYFTNGISTDFVLEIALHP